MRSLQTLWLLQKKLQGWIYIASQLSFVYLDSRWMKRKALAQPNWIPCSGNSYKVSRFTPQSCASVIMKYIYRKLSRQMCTYSPSYTACHLVLILLKASARNSLYCVRCYKLSVPVSKLECGFARLVPSKSWKEEYTRAGNSWWMQEAVKPPTGWSVTV